MTQLFTSLTRSPSLPMKIGEQRVSGGADCLRCRGRSNRTAEDMSRGRLWAGAGEVGSEVKMRMQISLGVSQATEEPQGTAGRRLAA